ncbi:MAG: tRNA (guanosine(37)-N1)-methyltransferase TrmD [Ruminococcus sp.]|nr:tRNA (guanosine(37)-N1)-methyltransferase TrmD [Ruminococcus sp.]
MRIDIATLFPEMCGRVLDESIIGRARKAGKIEVNCHNIRDWSNDKHRRVDDTTYGGGMGMLMQAEPIYRCFLDITKDFAEKPYTIYMSPKGTLLTQKKSVELSQKENIFIICGHYEGVDQRLIDKIVDEEISIGDYVLTGGELPALVLTDTVARMCEGVLSANICFEEESHYNGLLEYPQYTKPEEWEDMKVPEVLLSGHHKNIDDWRLEQAVEITKIRRPDMYEKYIADEKLSKIDNKKG